MRQVRIDALDLKDKAAYEILGQLAVSEKARHDRLEEIQRSLLAARKRHQRFTMGQIMFAAMVGMGAGVYAGVWVAMELILSALR